MVKPGTPLEAAANVLVAAGTHGLGGFQKHGAEQPHAGYAAKGDPNPDPNCSAPHSAPCSAPRSATRSAHRVDPSPIPNH